MKVWERIKAPFKNRAALQTKTNELHDSEKNTA